MKGPGLLKRPFLLPFSLFYRLGVMVRNRLFDLHILHSTRFAIPVISVGNITAGGTGKTPHVELLVRLLKDNHKLAVLSRGYKRKSSGFMLARNHSSVSEMGDESVQIKTKFPQIHVAVDNNRVHGVKKLLKINPRPDIIILDDAFQHRYIEPGLSILLVDYTQPVFKDFLLPAGNLREPWKNLKRAHIVIVTKCPPKLLSHERTLFSEKLRLHPEQGLYFTSLSYGSPRPLFENKKKNVEFTFKNLRKSHAQILLMTAIANPHPLSQFLKETLHGYDSLFFPDHHTFNRSDLRIILRKFQSLPGKNKYILVTEKDAVKLREMELERSLKKALLYIPIEVQFLANAEKPFLKGIEKYIKKASYR